MLGNLIKNNIPFCGSISNKDIYSLRTGQQHFSDCYLVSALESLTHTPNGRKILKGQIQYDDVNPDLINCYFYTPNGTKTKYAIPVSNILEGYEKVYRHQPNKIARSLDISVAEYEKEYKSKPLICRIGDKFKNFAFEFNMPSHFMKMMTGMEPSVNIAERSFNFNLKPYKEEVMELFERMDKDKNHCMVMGSGIKRVDGRRWHVYVIEDVNLAENTVTLKNKRGNISKTIPIDKALKNFKYIVGYFDKDLEHAPALK